MTAYIQTILQQVQLHATPDGACIATFTLPTFCHAMYAHGDSIEACIAAVESALESYVLWAMQTGALLPEIDGVSPPSLEPQHDSLVVDTNR